MFKNETNKTISKNMCKVTNIGNISDANKVSVWIKV